MEDSGIKFDESRVYTCRCPSCKLALNISGISLNASYSKDKLTRCPYCHASSRTKKWVEGGRTWKTL